MSAHHAPLGAHLLRAACTYKSNYFQASGADEDAPIPSILPWTGVVIWKVVLQAKLTRNTAAAANWPRSTSRFGCIHSSVRLKQLSTSIPRKQYGLSRLLGQQSCSPCGVLLTTFPHLLQLKGRKSLCRHSESLQVNPLSDRTAMFKFSLEAPYSTKTYRSVATSLEGTCGLPTTVIDWKSQRVDPVTWPDPSRGPSQTRSRVITWIWICAVHSVFQYGSSLTLSAIYFCPCE